MIEAGDKTGSDNDRLPTYSNTSDIYFRKNENNEVVQAKVYLSREMIMDLDWDHSHRNKSNGEFFPAGTIHVQIYTKNKDGNFVRLSHEARRMTQAEIQKYGPIIRYFNSDVIL